MKKIYSLLIAILFSSQIFAQAPQKMSYQAVIRNSSSNLITNTTVGMKISILQGSASGAVVYAETQTPSTDANGLVSLEIGSGINITLNPFSSINWAMGPYFIKTETDPAGGTAYNILGSSQLMSVPYALFSANGTPGPQGPQGPQGPIGLTGPAGANASGGETYVSAFQPTGCSSLNNSTLVYQKIGDMGVFTKVDSSTFIELTVQINLFVAAFIDVNAVVFELRVDDVATPFGNATALLTKDNFYFPSSILFFFLKPAIS